MSHLTGSVGRRSEVDAVVDDELASLEAGDVHELVGEEGDASIDEEDHNALEIGKDILDDVVVTVKDILKVTLKISYISKELDLKGMHD